MRILKPLGFKIAGYIKSLFFLIIIGSINPKIGFAQPYPYKFDYLTVDGGLSHTDANDIAQDKQGYIWIATYFGLDRYDGYSVKQYYNENNPFNTAFNNRIGCIYPDQDGNIWLGTEGGLQCFNSKSEKYLNLNEFNKQGNTGIQYLYKPAGNLIYALERTSLKLYLLNGNTLEDQKLKTPTDVHFTCMAADQNGLLYLTSNKGLWLLDKNKILRNISIPNFSHQDFSRLYFDKQNNLLLTSNNQLYLLRKKSPTTVSETNGDLVVEKYFTIDDNSYIKDLVEENKSGYWLNIGTGLLKLDSNLNLIQRITNNSSSHSLNSSSISKLLIDRSQCLWAATFGGGVNYCDLNEKLFYTLQHNPEETNSLSGNHIRSILEESENLWIGTTANGLNLYNLRTGVFTFYNTSSRLIHLKSNVISALAMDNDNNLWIGSSAGIEILKSGRKELLKPEGLAQFPTYAIETLAKDCYGNMWFGNHTDQYGVIWRDKAGKYHVKYYDEGYYILADKKNPQLFISSTQGLKRLFIDREGNITRTFYYKASRDGNALSSSYTYPVCKQNDSTYWIGTIGGGLNRLTLNPSNDTYLIKVYGTSYGVFKDVETLEIDNAGNLWMGGNGLESLNPVTEKLIRYDKKDGLQGNSFKVGASFKGSDGRLYFGGINGINYFYPDQIKTNHIEALPVLTDILINNQKPQYANADSSQSSIAGEIAYAKKVKLNYLQNNFEIFFSSMHFANPLKCKYRYKLEGFDREWQYTDGKNPSAAYSNLDYDQYKFIVQATNNDDVWSKSQAETFIIITPPWWKSTLAKIIYALLVLSFLAGIYIYQARWYRLKKEIGVREVNEKKKEEIHKHREELYQQQLMFFTNVSHEFRTPLTLILGPLESMISHNKDSVLNNSYQLMYRNAKRLVNLISELMNFKKVADSIIKLQVEPLVVKDFCNELTGEFQHLAIAKDIHFKVNDYTENIVTGSPIGYFDVHILEKILFNLLSNSFKYTNEGGSIFFDIFFDMERFKPSFESGFQLLNENHRAKNYIYFRVADSGVGISSESITKIFDRYYRVTNNHLGSGVGLALVKSLTQLHKGDIFVYSDKLKGTEIIIGIPWGEENYSDVEKSSSDSNYQSQLEEIDNSMLLPISEEAESYLDVSANKLTKHILLVDDNEELRIFLKQALGKSYYIYEAEDGNAALEIAIETVPDLIISDVMMPGMNGIELCKQIKERFETRHIPFIILSAKDALDTKIEGMESGADYYFAKPLSIDLLRLTVYNIFEQSEKLKQRYTDNYLSEATELVHSEKDKEFFNQILKLIEDNIEDTSLDADFLCKQLCISRTKLYQKIKSISDQSVSEFIRTIRLKKAILVMTHEDISMNEVVDRIGMLSSSNFSRAFKKEYGKSPMQYLQSLKNN